MPLTSRKSRPLDRTIEHLRDTKLCVIATEGEKTEKQYFDIFMNPKVQVKVIASEDGLSAPEHVSERLCEFEEQYQIGDGDELWLMIDVDRWGDAKLSQIAALISQKGFRLAISNPCFEVWLYLHFNDVQDAGVSCAQLEKLLRAHLGSYNKSNINGSAFKGKIRHAVNRAKRLHTNRNERWPTVLGTHVYKVVEKLLQSN